MKVFLYEVATKCTLVSHASVLDILYTIFDASVRPSVRSSVRPFAKIACFVIGSKSLELASRANTKAICEKWQKKKIVFLANQHRCANSREPVARSSLSRNSGQENSKNPKGGGYFKFKKWLFV